MQGWMPRSRRRSGGAPSPLPPVAGEAGPAEHSEAGTARTVADSGISIAAATKIHLSDFIVMQVMARLGADTEVNFAQFGTRHGGP